VKTGIFGTFREALKFLNCS